MLFCLRIGISAMRDIREDLKERVASVMAEIDELQKRENLLTLIQQSLYGLLEEEDRRFRDRVPTLTEFAPKGPYSEPTPDSPYSESTPNSPYSESTPNDYHGPERRKTATITLGSWAGEERKDES
jgi:hypothetical protein